MQRGQKSGPWKRGRSKRIQDPDGQVKNILKKVWLSGWLQRELVTNWPLDLAGRRLLMTFARAASDNSVGKIRRDQEARKWIQPINMLKTFAIRQSRKAGQWLKVMRQRLFRDYLTSRDGRYWIYWYFIKQKQIIMKETNSVGGMRVSPGLARAGGSQGTGRKPGLW